MIRVGTATLVSLFTVVSWNLAATLAVADETCTPLGEPCVSACRCCGGECNSGIVCGSEGCSGNGQPCASGSECCTGYCDPARAECESPRVFSDDLEIADCRRWAVCPVCPDPVDLDNDPLNCGACGNECAVPQDCHFGVCGGSELVGTGYLSCRVFGSSCTFDSECCSFRCRDDGAGRSTCRAADGCRPHGERCIVDDDCCNRFGTCNDPFAVGECLIGPGGVGRCTAVSGGAPIGEICDDGFPTGSSCCGGAQFCMTTSDCFDRCWGDGYSACLPPGAECGFGDQCCSGTCTGWFCE